MAPEFLFGLPKPFTGFKQRLAWNATNAQASPSQSGCLLDAGDIQAELSCTNRGDVSSRPRSNDYQIVVSRLIFQRRDGWRPLELVKKLGPPRR
jgi:hypothetical protein